MSHQPLFEVRGVRAGYPRHPDVVCDVDLMVPQGGFTAVVGPNGCGKSTLLLTLARLLRPASGSVRLYGRQLSDYAPRELARLLAFLPQQPLAPEGILVRDLVMRGRQPHRRFLAPASSADHRAVDAALFATATDEVADRPLADLSGGQRQRVWIAMTLAQDTGAVLLDEPTSFLDIAHQVDVLEACAGLVARGCSVVAVLHDLGLAARYADHLVVMGAGRIVAAGPPARVLSADLVEGVFGLRCRVVADPETGTPLVIPRRPWAAAGPRMHPDETDEADPRDETDDTDDRNAHALL